MKDCHELSIEAIAGVPKQPIVIVDLTERLARRTTGKQVELTAPRCGEDRLVVIGVSQITLDDLGIGMIQPIRRASIWIMVGSSQDLESRLPETLAQATCAAEQINGRFGAVGWSLRRHADVED